jgi:hypothetical protein
MLVLRFAITTFNQFIQRGGIYVERSSTLFVLTGSGSLCHIKLAGDTWR